MALLASTWIQLRFSPSLGNFLRTPAIAFQCPRFSFAEPPVKNIKTDNIWPPALQRQLWVTMCGGSYVVNLFKQKAVS